GTAWGADDLASAIGTSGKQVRDWIRGESRPQADNLAKLARALGVEAEALVRGEPKPINLPQEPRSMNGTREGEAASGAARTPGRRAGDQNNTKFRAAAKTMIAMMRLHHDAMRPYFDMLEILLLGSAAGGKGIHELTSDLRAEGAFDPSEALRVLADAAAHTQTQPPAGPPRPDDQGQA